MSITSILEETARMGVKITADDAGLQLSGGDRATEQAAYDLIKGYGIDRFDREFRQLTSKKPPAAGQDDPYAGGDDPYAGLLAADENPEAGRSSRASAEDPYAGIAAASGSGGSPGAGDGSGPGAATDEDDPYAGAYL